VAHRPSKIFLTGMQARITMLAMPDDPQDALTSPPLFRPLHVNFDVTPHSCSTNAGVSRQLGEIIKVVEKITKYAMLEDDTLPGHPAVVGMINASLALREAQRILDGPPVVAGPAGGPQMVARGGGRPH
jgi:hypothetical protein